MDDTLAADDALVYDDDWSLPHRQMVAQAVLPKIAAAFSILGSVIIAYEVFLEHRKGMQSPKSRILAGLSLADIIVSFGWFLSTWPAPEETTDYVWGARGTTGTCTLQGFLVQLGHVATPMYNLVLAWFYLLMVRYNWSDARLRKSERWVHAVIWLISLVSSIYPLFWKMYNNAWQICWLEPYPSYCLNSYEHGADATCTRGDNANLHALFFTIFPVWPCIIGSMIIMLLIFLKVRAVEKQMARYAGSTQSVAMTASSRRSSVRRLSFIATPPPPPKDAEQEQLVQHQQVVNRQRSRQVGWQAIWYVVAFFLTHILGLIANMMYTLNDSFFNYWFDLFAYFFLPLQGFLNFIVFLRTQSQMQSTVGKMAVYLLCCRGEVTRTTTNHIPKVGGHKAFDSDEKNGKNNKSSETNSGESTAHRSSSAMSTELHSTGRDEEKEEVDES